MRRLAFGGVGPGWAGGAVDGGEVFDGGGEVGHGLLKPVIYLKVMDLLILLILFLG